MSFLKVERWNSEASFEIAQPSSLSNVSHNVYDLGPSSKHTEGGVEWEVSLTKRPATNVFAVQFASKNLRFHYQPPLTEECDPKEYDEITETEAWKNGVRIIHRPEDVVGSYAVYHTSKRDNQYKAGKAFHIYRPRLADADGVKAWGAIHINPDTNVLTVTLPAAFMASAKYPVIVDPTFGYTTLGGSSWFIDPNVIGGSVFTAGSGGTVDKITIGLSRSPYNYQGRAVMYLHSDLSHVLTSNEASGVLTADAAWYDFTCGSEAFSADDYVLCYYKGPSFGVNFHYDAGAADQGHEQTGLTYPNVPDPLVPSHISREFSIYCTYTLVGGLSIPVAMNQYGTHINKKIRGG